MREQYEFITPPIAQGSDTVIYKGFDTLHKRNVFVKAFQTQAIRSWKRFELIQREEDILAQLTHPRIPELYATFAHEKSLYLVTEWIEGDNLAQKLEQGWHPTTEEVCNIAEQTLEILMYIHHLNPPIVHRDLKPSNLMLNAQGEVFLIDFGGALKRLYGQNQDATMVVGKEGYIAPEEYMGQASVSTDLYALGASLLKLITGVEPQTLLQTSTPGYWKQHCPGLSPKFMDWLEQMLAPHQHERFRNAAQALVALDQAQGKNPLARKPQKLRKAKSEQYFKMQIKAYAFEEEHALAKGTLLKNQYEISAHLGQGNLSRVYLAKDQANDQQVVLKELQIAGLDTVKHLELFEREIQLLSQIQHERIPDLIDQFQVQTAQGVNLYLVSQAIEGNSLSQLLENGWRPSHDQIWQIASELLEILSYLHGSSPPLIHRDIKPSNIVLGEDQQTYLIDFGAAQARQLTTGAGGSTIVFSMGYTAPEQYGGNATPTSDLYSLGTTLIHLLSGRSPQDMELAETGLSFEPHVHCGDFHLKWLRQMIHPKPQKRFQSADKALAHLQLYNPLLDTSISSARSPLEPPVKLPYTEEGGYNLRFERTSNHLHVAQLSTLPPLYEVLFPKFALPYASQYHEFESPPLQELIERSEVEWSLKLIKTPEKGLSTSEKIKEMLRFNGNALKRMPATDWVVGIIALVAEAGMLYGLLPFFLETLHLGFMMVDLLLLAFLAVPLIPLYSIYTAHFSIHLPNFLPRTLASKLAWHWESDFIEILKTNREYLRPQIFLKEIRVSHKHLSCISPEDELNMYEIQQIEKVSFRPLELPEIWKPFAKIADEPLTLYSIGIETESQTWKHVWFLNDLDKVLFENYLNEVISHTQNQKKLQATSPKTP